MAIQIWPCEEADVHVAAQFSSVGVGVDRVTSPAPPNAGTYYTRCPSDKLSEVSFTLANPTTYDSGLNRMIFNVEMDNLPGIRLASNPFVDIYRNEDPATGTANFILRAFAETAQYDHRLRVIDSTGTVVATVDDPFTDNTPATIQVIYAIHATGGWILVRINGALKVNLQGTVKTKVASSAQCEHTFTGHDNLGGSPPACETHYSGFRSDTDESGVAADFGFVRFRPNYNGIQTPARCNDVGTVITPGDNLTTSISEKISDDLGGINRCGHRPALQFSPLGGAWACNRIDNKGPVSFFGDQAVLHACQFQWWYDISNANADDPWLTYGYLDESGAYTMTAVNVAVGNNKVHQVTLVPADTYFPDVADKYAVAGLYNKAVGAVPRSLLLEQIWIYFCYDIGTESPERVRILGNTNILGKTEFVT